jgi:hypothetical protein
LKFDGDLRVGCPECKAQAVGEPLSRPEIELPFYGRSLFVGAVGAVMAVVFLVSTAIALFERSPASFGFWSLMSAAETASWRLKFLAIPVCICSLWVGLTVYRTISKSGGKFAGLGIARTGLALSALVTVAFAATIGITVPERLRQRQLGIEAGAQVPGYTIAAAVLKYKIEHNGTYPATLDELAKHVPDPDGSLARALAVVDEHSYQPRSDLAASLPKSKTSKLQGAAVRKTAAIADDSIPPGLAFTNYELRLPGPDKIPGTDDDLLMTDGVFVTPTTPGSGSNDVVSIP